MIFRTRIGKALFYRFFRLMGRPDIARIPPTCFLVNWFFQRVLGLNSQARFQVHFTSHVRGTQFMELGETVRYSMAVSGCANIVAVEGTRLAIGEKTIFAQNVCIRTANHDLWDRTKYTKADVTIGENCWLGHGVTILPGVQLGDNVTVGANAVVTQSFPDNVVVAGIPAKIIRQLDPTEANDPSVDSAA